MTTMTNDLQAARDVLSGLGNKKRTTRVLCAVSGGLDSMCLLHLLVTYGKTQDIETTAVHFNHQLRGAESDRDEAFVRDWCEAHGVELVCGRSDVRALAEEEKLSLEEAARKARYAFFEKAEQELSAYYVLTAHHADDNAETMLLNLLRGTGIRGLTGIPAYNGDIVRPLLHVTRQELEEYAAKNGIPHVEDSTNEEDCAARNILRHRVLPVLRELNPRAVEHMSRTAELLTQDEQALSAAAEALLKTVLLHGQTAIAPAEKLLGAERAVADRCILEMMKKVCGRQKDLTAAHVDAVYGLLRGGEGKEVSLPYGMRAGKEPADTLRIWLSDAPLQECTVREGQKIHFGDWTVELTKDGGGWELSLPADAEIAVTPWQRSDSMHLSEERGGRSLKRLCADRGITPNQRDRLPVLRVGGKPAVVPGVGVDLAFVPASADNRTIYVRFQEKEENIHEK